MNGRASPSARLQRSGSSTRTSSDRGVSQMTNRPFIVHVARLRRAAASRAHEQRSGVIPGLEVTGSRVPENSEVSADVVLEAVSGGIEVAGTVEAPWVGACRRSLN